MPTDGPPGVAQAAHGTLWSPRHPDPPAGAEGSSASQGTQSGFTAGGASLEVPMRVSIPGLETPAKEEGWPGEAGPRHMDLSPQS